MSESDTTSDTSASDTSDVDFDADFEEAVHQITSLHNSYEATLSKLQFIQDQIRRVDPLDAILDELHTEALQEIEETGESSFGAKLIARLTQHMAIQKIEMNYHHMETSQQWK